MQFMLLLFDLIENFFNFIALNIFLYFQTLDVMCQSMKLLLLLFDFLFDSAQLLAQMLNRFFFLDKIFKMFLELLEFKDFCL